MSEIRELRERSYKDCCGDQYDDDVFTFRGQEIKKDDNWNEFDWERNACSHGAIGKDVLQYLADNPKKLKIALKGVRGTKRFDAPRWHGNLDKHPVCQLAKKIGIKESLIDEFDSKLMESEMPPEVACRGTTKTKDGKSASFKAQWEGGSYNDGAILIVKVKGFKPNRYRIDTYAAQNPDELKRRIGNMDTSDSDRWESTETLSSDDREYYLLKGLCVADGVQMMALPRGTGTEKMIPRTKDRIIAGPMSKKEASVKKKELNAIGYMKNLKEAWGEGPYTGRREGHSDKTVDDLFGECYKEAQIPREGMAPTMYGEIVRAVNRIAYRAWNDGDYFCCGYGIQTCGNAAQFLLHEVGPHANEKNSRDH